MATWGGKRKGAGRPKGSKSKKKSSKKKIKKTDMTPLEFLKSVMNNEDMEDKDRIRAAIAAARYSHKLSDRNNKEEKDVKAKKASNKFKPGQKPQLKAIK